MATADNDKIIVYGTDWCSDCHRARNVLNEHAIDYVDIDIDRYAEARALVSHLNNGQARVPTIIFPDGSWLVEPSNRELVAKINPSSFNGD
jgi:glutaredoxin-like protein